MLQPLVEADLPFTDKGRALGQIPLEASLDERMEQDCFIGLVHHGDRFRLAVDEVHRPSRGWTVFRGAQPIDIRTGADKRMHPRVSAELIYLRDRQLGRVKRVFRRDIRGRAVDREPLI